VTPKDAIRERYEVAGVVNKNSDVPTFERDRPPCARFPALLCAAKSRALFTA
jgi:hypothetical protein